MVRIPLYRPFVGPDSERYVREAIDSSALVGDGAFSRRVERRLEELTGAVRVLLTPSGTASLELAAMSIGIEPGDEVVMPSFTFPSTANAFVLRGAVPVFCDIDSQTFNVTRETLEPCIGPRTRAVVVVHYAGNPADMLPIMELCAGQGIPVVEDAAQAIGADIAGVAAGRFGVMGALSFHGTKNVGCGEGGALLINDEALALRAEIHREKGTDRSRFLRGEVDKYSWQDVGSSWVVSELVAAFLLGQIEALPEITSRRLEVWSRYHEQLSSLEADGLLRRPRLNPLARHNGHQYGVLLPTAGQQAELGRQLRERGMEASRHYVPLHGSPAGRRWGRTPVPLPVTEDIAERLLRLPIWPGMPAGDQASVIESLHQLLRRGQARAESR